MQVGRLREIHRRPVGDAVIFSKTNADVCSLQYEY